MGSKLTEQEKRDLRKLEALQAQHAREKEEARRKASEALEEAERRKFSTVLLNAAKEGSREDVQEIIKDMNRALVLGIRDMSGNTALHKTAMYNNHVVAKLLIDIGANVDATEERGMTALMLAMANGFVETSKVLLEAGASLSLRSIDKRFTPLMYAARWGSYACCKLAIQREGALQHLREKPPNSANIADLARSSGFAGVAVYLDSAASAAAVEAATAAEESAAKAAARPTPSSKEVIATAWNTGGAKQTSRPGTSTVASARSATPSSPADEVGNAVPLPAMAAPADANAANGAQPGKQGRLQSMTSISVTSLGSPFPANAAPANIASSPHDMQRAESNVARLHRASKEAIRSIAGRIERLSKELLSG